MEFFDKLGKTASHAYKLTADKTGKIAKETKLKFKMSELKNQITQLYEEIGEKVYEKHIREEEISIKQDLEEYCIKIDVLSDEIDSLLKQCMDLKDKKLCPKCFKEIRKDDNYCSNCGQKQETEKVDDSFKGNEDKKQQTQETSENQNNKTEQKNQNNQEEQENQAKQVEEENQDNQQNQNDKENDKINQNNDEENNEYSNNENNKDNEQKNEQAREELEKTVEIEIDPEI